MRRKLPPLNPLRSFEAAARNRSFTIAGEELGVTQVAVSRQVRALEDYFGTTLFKRSHRMIALTAEAENLLPTLTRALDEIDAAVAAVSRRGRKDILSIHSYTTFSQRWLIPRLSRFHDEHPAIEVRLSASTVPVDFSKQNVDAAIRSGSGGWPGLEIEHLAPLELIPVCSPAFLRHATENGRPFDIRKRTLLHSLSRPKDWANWGTAMSLEDFDATRGLKFENSALSYEAALQGIGVAIGVRVLVEQNLRDGVLVAPVPFSHRVPGGYYLVHPDHIVPSPALRAFKLWLIGLARSQGEAQE